VARMEAVPWSGRIVEVADGHVYVNAGKDVNLAPGQRLVISNVAKVLTDPETGLKLGSVERQLGEVVVESVQEKYSVARPTTAMQPARGDLVRLATTAPGPASVAFGTELVPSEGPSLDVLRQTAQEYEALSAGTGQVMLPFGSVSMGVSGTSLGAVPAIGGVPTAPGSVPSLGLTVLPPASAPTPTVQPIVK
jgi:hypothetical protein